MRVAHGSRRQALGGDHRESWRILEPSENKFESVAQTACYRPPGGRNIWFLSLSLTHSARWMRGRRA